MDAPPGKTGKNLRETSLHLALKNHFTLAGDKQEVPIDGFLIDIVRGELLIEIQTRHFSALKSKIQKLIENHPVHLIYPIICHKWIIRLQENNQQISRRKSPKSGRLEDLFDELIRFPYLLSHPNFTLETALVDVEEIRRDDGKGSWRRKGWSIIDRRLISFSKTYQFQSPGDLLIFLPEDLPRPFSTRDLAAMQQISPQLARKMVYCLRSTGIIRLTGKKGREFLYEKI
jgi:hypothetical protein